MAKQLVLVIKDLGFFEMTEADVLSHLMTLFSKEILLKDELGKAHIATNSALTMVDHAKNATWLAPIAYWLAYEKWCEAIADETYIILKGQSIKAEEAHKGLHELFEVGLELILPELPICQFVHEAQKWTEQFCIQLRVMKALLSKSSDYFDQQSESFTVPDREHLKNRIAQIEQNLDKMAKTVKSTTGLFEDTLNQLPSSTIVPKPFWKAVQMFIYCSTLIAVVASNVHAHICQMHKKAKADRPKPALYQIIFG